MKTLIPLLAIFLVGRYADAWGGLFNRFSPEMLANMGYGGHGGFIGVSFKLQSLFQKQKRIVYILFSVLEVKMREFWRSLKMIL